MSTDLSFIEKLRLFDPENEASPSDSRTKDHLLNRLVAGDFERAALQGVSPKRRLRLREALSLTAAVAAGTACVLLFAPNAPTPHSDFAAGQHFSLASWTKTPTPATVSEADRDACAEALFDQPFDAASMHTYGVDHRGDFTSLLMTRSGAPLLCILNAGDVVGGDHMLAAHAPAGVVGAEGGQASIDQLGMIMIPDSDASDAYAGMTVAVGTVAADITSVTLTTPDGRELDATLSEGSWTAWYPDYEKVIPTDSPFALSEAAEWASTTSLPSISYTTTDGSVHPVPLPEWLVVTEPDTAGGRWSGGGR